MKMGYVWQEALSALDEPGESHTHPIYRVRQWQIGAALYLVGNILQFLSYAFAAQSLLLALSSAQFGTHLLFAWLMEGVNVPLRSILGAGIIISFNILLVVFGSKSSQLMTAAELLELFRCACDKLQHVHELHCHPSAAQLARLHIFVFCLFPRLLGKTVHSPKARLPDACICTVQVDTTARVIGNFKLPSSECSHTESSESSITV